MIKTFCKIDELKKKDLCVFAGHSEVILSNTESYIVELSKYVDDVHVILSGVKRSFNIPNVKVFHTENFIGLDFMKWYNHLKNIDISNYDKIWFVNDSCLILNSLEYLVKNVIEAFRNGYELYGINDSNIRCVLNNYSLYHITSFFRVLSRGVSKKLLEKIQNTKHNMPMNQNDAKNFIIKHYEVDFCDDMKKMGVKAGAMYRCEDFMNFGLDPHSLYSQHFIIFKKSWFDLQPKELDYVRYLNDYPDLKTIGFFSKHQAIEHYRLFGKNEGRKTYWTVKVDKNVYDFLKSRLPKSKIEIIDNYLNEMRLVQN